MNTAKARLLKERGMTLVEIIVVLVIIGIVMTVLTGGLFNQGEKAKARANKIKMDKLAGSVKEYQLMYNRFPSSLESLTNCTEETGTGCIPVAEKEDVIDIWSTPFVYQVSGSSYSIKSLGADRKDGGSGANADMTVIGP